ncbi:MAG: glycosyltransferase [Chloroflexi bacterium]|nr:MAG: glycosyltransferase [Chloroflexota bacterium]
MSSAMLAVAARNAIRGTTPRRVALVEFFGIGGTADYTDCLARALAGRGIEVAVVTSTLFEPLRPDPPYEIVRPFAYASTQPKARKAMQLARALDPARDFLEHFQPDVVHAQGTVLPVIERFLYRGLGMATVCTVHDARAHERRPWLGSFSGFYGGFDRLICHSESTKHKVIQALPGARIDVVPHGVYTPLAGALPDGAAARQQLQLPSRSRVALFFGFIRRYKGLDLFLEALQVARSEGHDLIGLVAGRPLYDVSQRMERARRDGLPVAWHLRFIAKDDIATFFAAADVVALPYTDTSDSGAFELAAAFRKPVVVTNAGGLGEAFARYRYGALVEERSAAAVARALMGPYPPAPPPSGDNSWEAVAAQTETTYQEALVVHG